MVMPRAFSSGAASIWSYALASPPNLAASTDVIAAVNVVLPWSTCPIVPTFACGLVRSNFAFDISLLSSTTGSRRAQPWIGAGDGNRTHTASLEGWSSTIELHPHHHNRSPTSSDPTLARQPGWDRHVVEGVGFEPTYASAGRFTVCCL